MTFPETPKQSREPNLSLEAWRGFRDIFPLLCGAAPFGLLIGSLAVQAGLSPLEITLMSASVYAGSAQFIALDIWSTPLTWGGTILVLVATTAMVNLRHILMGAALAPHVKTIPFWKRSFFISIHSDETWAITLHRVQHTTLTSAYLMGMIVPFYLQWIFFTALGATSGAWLGDPAKFGFDFVFPAAFLTLIFGFWQSHQQTAVILVSASTALILHSTIEGPWYIFCAGLAGAVTGAFRAPQSKA